MNIAVCDDQLDYLNLIKKKLIECFHEPEMELNVYTFSTIQEMLYSTKFRCYEFAFIEMKVENDRGIEAAYRAKIPVICIPDMKYPDEDYANKTTCILDSLHQVIDYIDNL